MTTREAVAEGAAVAGLTSVTARRVGFLSDDHNAHDDGRDLPAATLRALDGVDLIVHLGHMGVREVLGYGVLDRLSQVAPVLAVRAYINGSDGAAFLTPADRDRVAGVTRVIEANGCRIGAIHNLGTGPGPAIVSPPGGLPELAGHDLDEVLPAKFGGPVDVVAYAGSHRAAAVLAQGRLFVNPGSPTYPKGPGRVPGETPGTVGVLDVADGVASYEILELSLFDGG